MNVATGSTGVLQGVTVSGTTGNGVRVDTNAPLRLQTASTVITGNTGFGIQCFGAESSFAGDVAGVTGNGGATQVSCTGF